MPSLLAFRNPAWRVACRPDLSQSIRYLAQRLLQDLDPDTPLVGSGASRLDPLSAVVEIQRVAASHHAIGQPRPKLMRSMLRAAQSTLTAQSTDLTAWFGSAYIDADAKLTSALSASKADLIAHARSLERNELPALRAALIAGSPPYRRRLLNRIVQAAPSTVEDWIRLDGAIDLLGSTLVAEGRDGLAFAAAVINGLAASAQYTTAVTHLEALVDAPAEIFDVAVVIHGAEEPLDTAKFGCKLIAPPLKWPYAGYSQPAHQKLVDFRRRYGTGKHRSVLATDVEAFDAYGARSRAEAVVQALLDQYSARHRVIDFAIGMDVLTMRRASERNERLERRPKGREKAFTRAKEPIRPMAETFRYAALARAETSPVVQVLHRWIAVEALGFGGRTHPTASNASQPVESFPFVASRVPQLVALHAVRQSLTADWQVVRSAADKSQHRGRWREVKRWIGVSGSGRMDDLTRWTALLAAATHPGTAPATLAPATPVADVAAFLDPILADFQPFAHQTFRMWSWRLSVGSRLTAWASTHEAEANKTLVRMYALRNASVHSALAHADGAEQLAVAARNILDAVLEVMPLWMIGFIGRKPWEALNAISLRYQHVIRTNSHSNPARVDGDRLTTTAGDGVNSLQLCSVRKGKGAPQDAFLRSRSRLPTPGKPRALISVQVLPHVTPGRRQHAGPREIRKPGAACSGRSGPGPCCPLTEGPS